MWLELMKISTQKSEGDQKCNQKFMKNSGLKITLNGDKVMTMGESAEKAEVRKRKDYLEGKKRKRALESSGPGEGSKKMTQQPRSDQTQLMEGE